MKYSCGTKRSEIGAWFVRKVSHWPGTWMKVNVVVLWVIVCSQMWFMRFGSLPLRVFLCAILISLSYHVREVVIGFKDTSHDREQVPVHVCVTMYLIGIFWELKLARCLVERVVYPSCHYERNSREPNTQWERESERLDFADILNLSWFVFQLLKYMLI